MLFTQIQIAAKRFAAWAAAEGFFEGYGYANAAEVAALDQISDEGRRILRQRQVTQIGFDASANKVIVYLRRSVPGKKLLANLPAAVNGFELEYSQGVDQPIGSNHIQPQGCPPWRMRQAGGQARYTCGSSISVGNYMDAGTMGALVRDDSGILHGLSNNHVCGSCNHADIGLPIVAPGVFDVSAGGLDPFTIGYHHATLTMSPGSITVVNPGGNHDAAIFRIRDPEAVTSFQGISFDTPTVVADLTSGLQVEKVGRTTGYTRGVVRCQIVGPLPIAYSAPNYGFSGRVFYDPAFYICGDSDIFSDSGDSGSLIVSVGNDGTRAAVGIVVGGATSSSAPGGKITVALPIRSVLSRLNLTLVSGHNI